MAGNNRGGQGRGGPRAAMAARGGRGRSGGRGRGSGRGQGQQENGDNNNDSQSNGGRGGGDGGGQRGGRGAQTWGNKEWREKELGKKDKGGKGGKVKATPFDSLRMMHWLRAFSMSNLPESLVEGNWDKAAVEEITGMALSIGLFCETYGTGDSQKRNTLVSKNPLARYRAEYDNSEQHSSKVRLPTRVIQQATALLEEFRALGLPGLPKQTSGKRGRGANRGNPDGEPAVKRLEAAIQGHNSVGALSSYGDDADTTIAPPMAQFPAIDRSLLQAQEKYERTDGGRSMRATRSKLPAFNARDELLDAIARHQVIVVSGETGCGKTTQVPQFILEESIAAGAGSCTSIVCTQPRRISAVSIAQRVATERGETVGRTVGYSIRLESKASEATRLLFCTTGVLLRRLISDPSLAGVSHVLVDEIHERGINEDLLLIILKGVLPRRPDLRIILMSATLNADTFQAYYPGSRAVHIPGFTFPVKIRYLEGALALSGQRFRSLEQGRGRGGRVDKVARKTPFDELDCHAQTRGMHREDVDVYKQWWEAVSAASATMAGTGMVQVPFVADFVQWLHRNEGPGAILVFCTGLEDIRAINDELLLAQKRGGLPGANIIPLHGSMPTMNQQSIFRPSPPGERKILLATNIAETSITIDDVTIVVDTGMHKIMTYDALNKLSQLTPAWVAKANAKQRAGRAGRVQSGTCYRLYPEAVHGALQDFLDPEMQRIPLENVCLQIKSLGLGEVGPFLQRAMDAPEPAAVVAAIQRLQDIGAVSSKGEVLTPLGVHLTNLPLDPSVGKLLVMGAVFDCLDPVLTIAAALSYRDPFVSPLEQRGAADRARKDISGGLPSDHATLVEAFDMWQEIWEHEGARAARDWCQDHFLLFDTLTKIRDTRLQLARVLADAGFLFGCPSSGRGGATSVSMRNVRTAIEHHSMHYHGPPQEDDRAPRERGDQHLLQAMLVAGLYPNVGAVLPGKGKAPPGVKTFDDGAIKLHPASVVSDLGNGAHSWLVFTEKLRTKDIFVSNVTLVSDVAMILFGGPISTNPIGRQGVMSMHAGFFEFVCDPASQHLLLAMRNDMNSLLDAKLANPRLDVAEAGGALVRALLTVLHSQ